MTLLRLSTALAATPDGRTVLTVRVYQTAGLSSAAERRALAEAGTVLRAGGIDVRWHVELDSVYHIANQREIPND